MNLLCEQQASNKKLTLSILFWMFLGLLLYCIVQSTVSAEGISKHARYNVEISGFAFVPNQLELKAGDSITWINKDIVPHNIVESIDQKIISPNLSAGETYTLTVKEAMMYHCEFHPTMKGSISLTPVP